jgi:cell division protein FtsB
MSLVKSLNIAIIFLIGIVLYSLFFGVDNKLSFENLQNENQKILKENEILTQENNTLELSIKSRQKNDAHAEKFAREELNLIYKDEQFLSFKEINPNEPKK